MAASNTVRQAFSDSIEMTLHLAGYDTFFYPNATKINTFLLGSNIVLGLAQGSLAALANEPMNPYSHQPTVSEGIAATQAFVAFSAVAGKEINKPSNKFDASAKYLGAPVFGTFSGLLNGTSSIGANNIAYAVGYGTVKAQQYLASHPEIMATLNQLIR